MHKLNRPLPPASLGQYRHGLNNWRDVTVNDKSEIWLKIDEMQRNRCAYCECQINTQLGMSNAHIEHFQQRDRYSQGTFLWSNIFGSCNRPDSCGKHKDTLPRYTATDLIKMDNENPEQYLEFLPDGSVMPKKGLDPNDKWRAEETIRIFNLNGSLRQIRESMVKGYIQTAEELASYAVEFEEAEWLPILQDELDKIKDLPFTTAIKHILLPA